MRPFTPWTGVDSPSRGEVLPCLGFWFLNPSARQVCFELHSLWCQILFVPCILFEEPFILSPYFLLLSWEKLMHIFFFWIKVNFLFHKCVLVVCLFYCFHQKKNWGRRSRILFFLYSFSNIVCVFVWYLSSLSINIICLYMIESLCQISTKFSCAS
jgi:hypothetical protein